ncbi:MAG: prolipoprotein diacylglyceryl transferase, partial [Nanoarchaeota archaeon]
MFLRNIHKTQGKWAFMFTQSINPILLNLGPLEIRWYGLLYATGWLVAYFLIGRELKKKNIGTEEQFQQVFLYALLAGVIGARIGSVISDLPYYIQNPLEIFAIWHGGVAFHGGLAGLLLVGWWQLKKIKVDFLKVTDVCAGPIALALGIGRIGNFINSEFYGTVTNLPWGVVFPRVDGARHPVQLYESIMMVMIFLGLLYLGTKKLKKGTLFAGFLISYGVGRFLL